MDSACKNAGFTLSIGIYGADFGSCILAPYSSKSNRNNELAYAVVCRDDRPQQRRNGPVKWTVIAGDINDSIYLFT